MPLSGVRAFVREFAPFLERDARHHVWLSSLSSPATLVYDNHNLIYAYGDLPAFQATLDARGVHQGRVEIPAPHVHRYNSEFDADEDRVMKRWDWIHFPLEDSDDP